MAVHWGGRGPGHLSRLAKAAGTPTPTPPPAAMTKWDAEGDSLTAQDYAYAKLYSDANPGVTFVNRAVGGAILGTLANAGDNGNSLWGRVNTVIADNPSHLSIMIGANDFAASGTATDAATYYARVMEYINYFKAARPNAKIIVFGNLLGSNAFRNATAMALWALYRAGAGVDFDVYVPIGEHPTCTAAWHTDALNSDGLHPTADGWLVYSQVSTAALDSIRLQTTATSPAAFSFTDADFQPYSTPVSSRVLIIGLRAGRTATASVTGGNIARGQGAAGTGSFPVVVGDFVTASHNTAATFDTLVNTAVTVGGTSDTFTSRTFYIPTPVITRQGAPSSVLNFSVNNLPNVTGYYWQLQLAGSADFLTNYPTEGAIRDEVRVVTLTDLTDDDNDGTIELDPFAVLASQAAGLAYLRIRLGKDNDTGTDIDWGSWSNIISDTVSLLSPSTLDPTGTYSWRTFSNGDLTVTSTAVEVAAAIHIRSTQTRNGHTHFEVEVDSINGGDSNDIVVGVATAAVPLQSASFGPAVTGFSGMNGAGSYYADGVFVNNDPAYAATANTIYTVDCDPANNLLKIAKNGGAFKSMALPTSTEDFYVMVMVTPRGSGNLNGVTVNFGASAFSVAPSGGASAFT